jgi:subtilase family serine protease
VAALAAPVAALSNVADAAPTHHGFVATQTRAMPLTSHPLGRLAGHHVMRVSLGLALRHKATLDRLAEQASTPGSAAYRNFLTPKQVRHRFGPTASSVVRVAGWLRHSGFTHVSAAPNGLLVDAQAPARTVERAFRTRLMTYRLHGRRLYSNSEPAMVPASLAGTVVSVLGLSDVPMHFGAHRTTAKATAGSLDLDGFTPRQVSRIYDANTLPGAKHTSVGLVMMGNMRPIIKNLRFAERKEGYGKVRIKVVYGGPRAAITRHNPLTGNAEWDLDTQISTMEAKNVKRLYIYDEQTFTDEDVARGMNEFVSQGKATTGSASLGECDYIAWADGAMLTTDEALEEGAIQGQSFFASTGDNGSFCPEVASTGVPGGAPGVSWPAVGTWTTAAGGTTVLADDQGHVTQETAWVGGGGGTSPFETGGDWTIPANTAAQTAQFTNQGGRAVPDVSALADENTPVLIYTGGKQPEGVGGTSVSAPLLSGLWARIQGRHHNRLGVASVRFYRLYDKTNPGTVTNGPTGPVTTPSVNPAAVPGFRDIVLGTNGAFQARPGWDETTGIGSLLVARLSRRL